MRPKIIAVAGPLKAAIFELKETEISIGRESQNHIIINDLSVSRQHCLLKKEGWRYKIADRNSHNRTFVNGRRLSQEYLLQHGDQIKIGSSSFVFLLDEPEFAPSSNNVQLEEDHLITNTAVKIHIEDALCLMARDLRALLDISMRINSIRSLESSQRHLLEQVFEVVPAEEGAILLASEGSTEFTSMFSLERNGGPRQTARVSRTIAQQVLRERVAVLSNDILESSEFSTAQSLISSKIKSLLCVPLLFRDKALGVIYVYTRNPETRFDKDQLQIVTAIANVAAGSLANAQHIEGLESENQRLRTSINIQHNLIGNSSAMNNMLKLIAKVALTDLTVLITGESGTGKELAARAIHNNSPRASRPFIAINCAALAESLLESELFGHEKGAFTDARAQRKGPLEMAEGGTVFLDEIGEMTHAAQSKLLRVLQEREVVRVGNSKPIKVNVRFIAATNRDLEEAIKEGRFRRDLYFRLNVFPLVIPPLRERREDILLLANHFIDKHRDKCQHALKGISAEARAHLVNYEWPGNIRELENAVEHALALSSTEDISLDDLPSAVCATVPAAAGARKLSILIREAKKQFIAQALEQTNGNYVEAAMLLGIRTNNLHRLVTTLNLRKRIGQQRLAG
jgi:Nif-specific regulatory protein